MTSVPRIPEFTEVIEDCSLSPSEIEAAFRIAARDRNSIRDHDTTFLTRGDRQAADRGARITSCSAAPESHRQQVRVMAAASPVDDAYYKHGLKPVAGGKTMECTLKRLGAVRTGDVGDSKFVKPIGIFYELDGKTRKWDMVETHPSVAVVIYHKDLKALLLVRQFRPAVYVALQKEAEKSGKPPPNLEAGFTYELCAGIVDKSASLEQIAAEEVRSTCNANLIEATYEQRQVLEECGFKVEAKDVKPLAVYHSAIGFSGSKHHIFSVQVDSTMQVQGSGGGLEDTGESIEVLSLPLENVEDFIADDTLPKAPGFMYGALHYKVNVDKKT